MIRVLLVLRKYDATTLYLIKEAMKKNILGCVKILIQKVTCAKFVRYFMKCQVQNLVEIGGMVA